MNGSHSALLMMILFTLPKADEILAYVGKVAPPIPEIPARRTASMHSSGVISSIFLPSFLTVVFDDDLVDLSAGGGYYCFDLQYLTRYRSVNGAAETSLDNSDDLTLVNDVADLYRRGAGCADVLR